MTETDVERVARALADSLERDAGMWSGPVSDWHSWIGHARAAIAALSHPRDDDLIERAAKVAEEHATCGCNGKHGRCMVDDLANAIASDIRALANPTPATAFPNTTTLSTD